MPVTITMWISAALPIIVLIFLMLKLQWGATKAAPLCMAITIAIAMTIYKAGAKLILFEGLKGVWNAAIILLIVFTAILLYQVGSEAKAFTVIRSGMNKLIPNQLLLILAIGWIFSSFLQSITGFGVPVAVGAPILIGIGVQPLWAVIISLLGQAWGNTFGTLAAAWDALTMTAGLEAGSKEYLSTAMWTATFICFWNFFAGFAMCWFYGKAKAVKKGFFAVLTIGIVQGVGEMLLTQFNTTISCVIPSCLSVVTILVLSRTKLYNKTWSVENSPIMEKVKKVELEEEAKMNLGQAFIPYVLLSAITFVVLLIKPINQVFNNVVVGFGFPQTETGYQFINKAVEQYSPLHPLTHASFFLVISALIGLVYYSSKGWLNKENVRTIFKKTVDMTIPSGIAVLCLVIMSKVMDGTGMTIVLASGITAVLGNFYIILAPFIGLLGSFMTGSNVSSNILFSSFQMTTAQLLGTSVPAVLGAQSSGGAIGSVISPSKIILGTTTANILGQEGKILRKVLLITLPVVMIIGVFLFILLCVI